MRKWNHTSIPSWEAAPILQRAVYGDLTRKTNHTWIPREKPHPYYKEVCMGISRGRQTIHETLVISRTHITKRCVWGSHEEVKPHLNPSWEAAPILRRGVYGDLTRKTNHTWTWNPGEKPHPYYKEVCMGISRGRQTIHEALVRSRTHITKWCV